MIIRGVFFERLPPKERLSLCQDGSTAWDEGVWSPASFPERHLTDWAQPWWQQLDGLTLRNWTMVFDLMMTRRTTVNNWSNNSGQFNNLRYFKKSFPKDGRPKSKMKQSKLHNQAKCSVHTDGRQWISSEQNSANTAFQAGLNKGNHQRQDESTSSRV